MARVRSASMLVALLALVTLASSLDVDPSLATLYTYHVKLHNRFIIYWSVVGRQINIAHQCQTIGWCAFGLSQGGLMIDSDAFIVGVADGKPFADDYHITSRLTVCPGICKDTGQGGTSDLKVVSGTQTNGVTTVHYTRQLKTSDPDHDWEITNTALKCIWSMTSNEIDTVEYHGTQLRGQLNVNFFTGESVDTTDKKRQQLLTVHGTLMPAVWCGITVVSVFIARYFKPYPLAMSIHRWSQTVVLVFALVAGFISLLQVPLDGHGRTSHGIMGLLFSAMCSVQGTLGNLITFKFFTRLLMKTHARRLFRKFCVIAHQILGKLVVSYGFAVWYMGFQQMGVSSVYYTFYFLNLATALAAFGVFETLRAILYLCWRKGSNRVDDEVATRKSSRSLHGEQDAEATFPPATPYEVTALPSAEVDKEVLSVCSDKDMKDKTGELIQMMLLDEETKEETRDAWNPTKHIIAEETKLASSESKLQGRLATTNTQFTKSVGVLDTKALSSPAANKLPIDASIRQSSILLSNSSIAGMDGSSLPFRSPREDSPTLSRAPDSLTTGAGGLQRGRSPPGPSDSPPGGLASSSRGELPTARLARVNSRKQSSSRIPGGISFDSDHSEQQEEEEHATPAQVARECPFAAAQQGHGGSARATASLHHGAGDASAGECPFSRDEINFHGLTLRAAERMIDGVAALWTGRRSPPLALAAQRPAVCPITGHARLVAEPVSWDHSDVSEQQEEEEQLVSTHLAEEAPARAASPIPRSTSPVATSRGGRPPVRRLVDVVTRTKVFHIMGFIALAIFCLNAIATAATLGYVATQPESTSESTTAESKAYLNQYFIACEEVDWDYSPSGWNNFTSVRYINDTTLNAAQKVWWYGRVFKKAQYIEYTDATFTVRAPKEPHLGILGPVLRAEVGDTLQVLFRNNCSHPFSLHPHGVFYSKANEGFRYNDGTQNQPDDAVLPGMEYNYIWPIPARAGPGPEEPSSVPWIYHSHVMEREDTNAGLIAPIIVYAAGTTKKGSDGRLRSKDADREFVIGLISFDETSSIYFEDNKARTLTPEAMNASATQYLWNQKLSVNGSRTTINGMINGNLPGLDMVQGERIRVYMLSMGNQEYHTVVFHGHSMERAGLRQDAVNVMSATLEIGDFVAGSPATYVINCHMDFHIASMSAFYRVHPSGKSDTVTIGATREYFISIDEVEWNYMPSGYNVAQGRLYTAAEADFTVRSATKIGPKFMKSLYREYTDATFTTLKPVDPDWMHKGFLGPIIRAEVGDLLKITLRNNSTRSANIALHGNFMPYEKGIVHNNNAYQLNPVGSGNTTVYSYYVSEECGPSKGAVEHSANWAYHSDISVMPDRCAGLVGMVIVTRAGFTRAKLRGDTSANGVLPVDVDREFVLLSMVSEEPSSPYYLANFKKYSNPAATTVNAAARTPATRFTFNGYQFGNGPFNYTYPDNITNSASGFNMRVGERVRWYLLVLGAGSGFHSPIWHGHTSTDGMKHTADADVAAASMTSVRDMIPKKNGTWHLSCGVQESFTGGMQTTYSVIGNTMPDADGSGANGTVYTHYIAADEVIWDYAPLGYDFVHAKPFEDDVKNYVVNSDRTIGPKYFRLMYREYSDATFTKLMPPHPRWAHKGFLGPVFTVEVGDTINIVFKNRAFSLTRSYNMFPQGGLSSIPDSQIPSAAPGQTVYYTWYATNQTGPATMDLSSHMWIYRSTVDEVGDLNAGLIGTIIVSRKDTTMDAPLSGVETSVLYGAGARQPKEVNREFVMMLWATNENLSPYLTKNVQTFCNSSLVNIADTTWTPFNIKHALNGYVFGNNPVEYYSANGDISRWYVITMGAQIDIHTAHWHAQTLLWRGKRLDVLNLLPAALSTLDMTCDNPGLWLMHCHVNDHLVNGMQGLFRVAQ